MLASIQQRVGFEWRSFEEVSGSGVACFGMNHFAGESRPVEVPLKVRLRPLLSKLAEIRSSTP